jgi:hypothetical protein
MDSLKRIVLWDYRRGTWQYDVLCLLIIAFIFLTPKSWFDRREKLATQPGRVIVKTKDVSPRRIDLERKVREMSGSPAAELLSWHETIDGSGERFYEVDFR